jgi:hypothetical protein
MDAIPTTQETTMNTQQTSNLRPDYKAAAQGQLFFAKMARLYGEKDAAEAHLNLASVYVKDALKLREKRTA